MRHTTRSPSTPRVCGICEGWRTTLGIGWTSAWWRTATETSDREGATWVLDAIDVSRLKLAAGIITTGRASALAVPDPRRRLRKSPCLCLRARTERHCRRPSLQGDAFFFLPSMLPRWERVCHPPLLACVIRIRSPAWPGGGRCGDVAGTWKSLGSRTPQDSRVKTISAERYTRDPSPHIPHRCLLRSQM